MSVLKGCKPRKEVLHGDLQDAIFAADFGDLIADNRKTPPVYGDPKVFFQNTHPAKKLRTIVEAVFGRLADTKEGGAALRLSTGFGGGKTHTLMALWHLAHNIGDASLGTDLLPAAGRPKGITVVAIDAGKAGVPLFGSHGKTKTYSLHGEIFRQLGGEKALKDLGKTDDPEASPSEAQLSAIFPKGPVLVLLDELAIYMAKLSDRGQGNLLGFINSLSSVVTKRPQTVLVVTDPAMQVVYAKESAQLGQALTAAALKLDEVYGRKLSDFDPIGDEAAKVITRRLFEKIDAAAAQQASAAYHTLFERVIAESPTSLPHHANSPDFAKRIVECYPFHPRLLDTAQDRLGALEQFQKSRGVLRLFARILRDVWEAKREVDLISAGEIDWSSPRIQADLLQRLDKDNFKASVSADVEKHARELDGGSERGVHQRAASALLLESLPMQANSGLDPADLTLAVLRPDEAGPEPAEALDRLVGVCWHTYPMPGGRGWQFRYEPNIIKQIEERMGQIPVEDARARVLAEVQSYFSGPTYKLAAWPKHARQVPESPELQLVLCEDEKSAKSVCAFSDDTDPQAAIPRRFQNAILAVTAAVGAMNSALDRAQRLMAAEAIEREHRSGESARLVKDQLQRIKPELHKQFRLQTCRAFDRVVFPGGTTYSIEEQYQVAEEQILQRAQGQACLARFLAGKGLVYQAGDALDVHRFLKDILPGATHTAENRDVYTAKAIHERFLAAPGLRLLPDGGVVRQTLLRALSDGKIVVRLFDGRAYDATGMVQGPQGARRRAPGTLTTLALDDSIQVALAASAPAVLWLAEDKGPKGPGGPGGTPPPPRPPKAERITAVTWDAVREYAATRPLVELTLTTRTPADAASLLALVQPLGAEGLALDVTVGGTLRDGGTINFAAGGMRPNHPAKPLQLAQTLFNALADGATYEAGLALSFGADGRADMASPLEDLASAASTGIAPRALFGKPSGDPA